MNTKKRLGGSVYILPNLLTTGNLFCGFYSIISSLKGDFTIAANVILLATIFDVLDGRVARMTKGTSEFGVQYDSLCDLLSFGCAPAILMYQFGLHNYGRIGWVLCFLYLACGALRLARFNVQSAIGTASGDFTGLPIPMAAIVIATFVSFVVDFDVRSLVKPSWLESYLLSFLHSTLVREYFMIISAPFLSLAMVSNVIYRSHKTLKLSFIKPFKFLSVAVFVIAFISYRPEAVGFFICLAYSVSGPLEWLIGGRKPTLDEDIFSIGSDQSIQD